MKYIIKCSSGKDSEASIWWAYHNLPFECWEVIFDDTEWESDEVYKHLKYLEFRVGKTFINLRSTRFKGKLSQDLLDKIIEIFGHRSIFAEMVLSRGRFPSTKGRFCTEELKIWPTIDWILDNVREDCVIVQGVRAEESAARRNMSEKDEYFKFYFEPFGKDNNGRPRYHSYRKQDVVKHCDQYSVDVLRPILKLTHQQVFNIIFENDSPGNKLYYQGFKRVGCFPCINSGLGEVLQIALNYPDRIRQIRELEILADSTFFTIGDIPQRYCTIKRTVNVYRQDLIKIFGKKQKKDSAHSGVQLFETTIKNPEEHLYQIWFKNDKIPVYTDEDGDEFILRNVRCPTIDDVVKYAMKNPDQINLFNKTGGCVSVYSICEVNSLN